MIFIRGHGLAVRTGDQLEAAGWSVEQDEVSIDGEFIEVTERDVRPGALEHPRSADLAEHEVIHDVHRIRIARRARADPVAVDRGGMQGLRARDGVQEHEALDGGGRARL